MAVTMRFGWEGRSMFDGGPDLEYLIQTNTTLSSFAEALEQSAIPQYRGTASERWRVEGLPSRDGIVTPGTGYARNPLLDVATRLVRDWVLYRSAGVELSVAEDPSRPAVMHLPGWSLAVDGDQLGQRRDHPDEVLTELSRGAPMHPPPEIDAARASLERLVDIARREKKAFSLFPQAIRGEGPVRPLEALRGLSIELLRTTREVGYVPAFSRVALTPEYQFLRRLRMCRWGMAVRRQLLAELNRALAWFADQDGFDSPVVLSFDEAWTESDLSKMERELDEGELNLEKAAQQLRFEPDAGPQE